MKLVAKLISILKRVLWGGTAVGPLERSPLLTSSSSQQTSYTHNDFERYFKRLFGNRPKTKSNLPGYLERLLLKLRSTKGIIFVLADKNLGPLAVTLEQYIKDGLIHLINSSTYEIISEQEALERNEELRTNIRKWIMEHAIDLPQEVRRFLRSKVDETETDPFGCFYLLYKIHKTSIKIRPVCSDCDSTTRALGMWVD